MDLGLTGKVVVVTGGAGGIGEATVRRLAQEGAVPVIIDIDRERGEALAAELDSAGAKHRYLYADLVQERDCKDAVDRTVDELGGIDVLINNAGTDDGVGLTATPAQFMDSLRRNLCHYFMMAHFAFDALQASKGVIINIASKVAVTGQGETSGYAAAKGGILGLTREWASDLARHGIRVNAVVPSEVWTPQYEAWVNQFDNPGQKLAEIGQRVPLGQRLTTPAEIADAIVFLASERSSHTTGQHVVVDGGYIHLDRLV